MARGRRRGRVDEEVFKMTKINRNELTKEQIKKAMACKDAES
jgi:hypothetical protein